LIAPAPGRESRASWIAEVWRAIELAKDCSRIVMDLGLSRAGIAGKGGTEGAGPAYGDCCGSARRKDTE
jgi:hypothetical protein